MAGKITIGFAILLLGVSLLLNALNIEGFTDIFSYWWPAIFIVFGGSVLVQKSSSKITGVIFVVLGTSLLLVTNNILSSNIFNFVWPIILILLGLWIMIPSKPNLDSKKDKNILEKNQIDVNAFFSGIETKIENKDFVGGQITSVFGEAKIDFSRAKLSEFGAQIETSAIFGAVEIVVPKDMPIEVKGTPIFGGFENKVEGVDSNKARPKLRIKGVAIFGGVEIKNS